MRHVLVSTVSEARRYIAQGFCPIECSIGGESIVDDLIMDHHGPHSHLESVAIRAYRDLFGARREDPRFVTAIGDADACFAAAALAGELPHPSRDVPSYLPSHIQRARSGTSPAWRRLSPRSTCPPSA